MWMLRALALLGLAALAGSSRAQVLDDPDLVWETAASGISLPTSLAFLGPDDFLITEKNTGRVRRVIGGVLQPQPVLDVDVHYRSERGLLGIAINSESPPTVFLYYSESPTGGDTNSSGTNPLGNRIYAYQWDEATGTLINGQLLADLAPGPGPQHDGGTLQLGPPGQGSVGDGRLLYAVIGDVHRNGQLQNFPSGAAPDNSSVILRLQQDGTPAADNPFLGLAGGDFDRFYAYGIRNSFGIALDPVTGKLWQTENGPRDYDEVNLVEPGFNSGWERIMGPESLDPDGIDDLFDVPGAGSTYSDPEFSWFDTIAPTAIVFPAGSALGPDYDSTALVADSNRGRIYAFPLNAARDAFDFSADPAHAPLLDLVADDDGEADLVKMASNMAVITDLKIGPDGALYVVSWNRGRVYRVTRSASAPRPIPLMGNWGLSVLAGLLMAVTVAAAVSRRSTIPAQAAAGWLRRAL